MVARSRRLHVVVEILLAAASLHLVFLFVFRRYPAPIGWPGEFLPGAVLVFALVWIRMRTDWASRNEVLDAYQRLRPGFWLRGLSGSAMVLLGCFLCVFFVLHEYGGRIGNDGTMLFSYVRSMVIDGDLNLENEFDEFLPVKFDLVRERLESGRICVPHQELGPALLWLPFFVSTHVLVKVGAALGGAIPADGYSYPYIHAVCFGSLIYAFLGVVLSYLMVREYFTPGLASWGTVVLWLASPLFWYTVYEPSMPHAISFAGVAFFLFCCFRVCDGESLVAWMLVGLSAGVMVSLQRYNIYFLIVPVVILLSHLRQMVSRRDKVPPWAVFRLVGLSFLAFVVASAPLWLYHLSATGAVLRRIDLPSKALVYWRSPSISAFLFSSNHGLFSWTPVAYLSVLGLIMMLWRRKWIAGVYLVTLSAGIYLLSSTWEEGASFGSRRMTEAFPMFLVGFCGFLAAAKRSPTVLVATFCAFLVIWNLGLALQVRRGEVPQMGTFSFSEAAARSIDRVYRAIGHPSSIPASWIFSAVYGVPPSRFDTVWGHRAYHNLTIDVGSPSDDYFLGQGWSIREEDPNGQTYRWSTGSQSSWLISLFEPYRYRLRLTGEASGSRGGLPLSIVVVINGRGAGQLGFTEGREVVETIVPSRFWKPGLNEIVFQYNRTVRADEVYGGSDPRQIGLRLETLEMHIER